MTNISRNFNRGKSFRFDGAWDPRQVYKNDDVVQDFVTYKGVLYACKPTKDKVPCVAKVPHPDSAYWDSVIGGVAGGVFTPHVDENGNLTWTNDAGLVNPSKVNIQGPAGKSGVDGHTPVIGVRKRLNVNYWTVDGDWLLDEWGNMIPTTGKDGQNGGGTPGSGSGEDGITPLLDIKNEYWYVSYDNGVSWEKLYKSVGEDGEDGVTPQLRISNDEWYVSYDSRQTWLPIGRAVGDPGKDGRDGKDGKDGKDGADGEDGLSAYQIWLNAGNSGSEQDFLDSLKGGSGTQTVTNWDFWKTN